MLFSDDDSGCALEEFAWVPPGLKPEQVKHIGDTRTLGNIAVRSGCAMRELEKASP